MDKHPDFSATRLRPKLGSALFAEASFEFRIVAACCAWPQTTSQHEQLSALLAGTVNWKKLVQLAERHRVTGFVHAALAKQPGVPAETLARLSHFAARIAKDNLLSVAISGRVAKAFARDAIPFVVLKGAPLSQLAFGTTALRHSRDIDILLDPAQVERADALLQQMGFQQVSPGKPLTPLQCDQWMRFRKHYEYVHAGTGVQLEMHWRAYDNKFLGTVPLQDVHLIELGPGITLPALPAAELLLYLCLHGASHAWFRLKWITDVAALLRHAEAPSASELLAMAKARGVDRPVMQTLQLCHAMFGEEVPELTPSRLERWLVLVARDALLTESTQSASAEADFVPRHLTASHFLLCREWRYKLEEARIHSASPADWEALPLPAWLHALYPLLRAPLWIKRRWFARKPQVSKVSPVRRSSPGSQEHVEETARC